MAREGLERLGYYNGQRLEAFDYRLEQSYHVAVRRLLNRGLFTPGVVSGFIVEKIAGQTRKVRVRQGVALDPVGREIVLLDDAEIDVPNQKPAEGPGFLLIARYGEEAVEGGDPWCSGPSGAPRPARFREEAVLDWSEHAPDHNRCRSGSEGLDCGVLLALVTLTPSCEVDAIFTGVREYARPAHISQITPFSFEGEKDIDSKNPKRLRFNIDGVPASVKLYLWGDRFSTLYYTELGEHSHTFDTWPTAPPAPRSTGPASKLDEHTHKLPDASGTTVDKDPDPALSPSELRDGFHNTHELRSNADADCVTTATGGTFNGRTQFISDGFHSHKVSISFGGTASLLGNLKLPAGSALHTHLIPDTSPFGSIDIAAHGPHETSYGYLDDLHVALRVGPVSTDITDAIQNRLPMSWLNPATGKRQLGRGNPNDPLNTDGTDAIDLLDIANEKKIDLSLPQTYELTFSVANGGGKVAYNLFVA